MVGGNSYQSLSHPDDFTRREVNFLVERFTFRGYMGCVRAIGQRVAAQYIVMNLAVMYIEPLGAAQALKRMTP